MLMERKKSTLNYSLFLVITNYSKLFELDILAGRTPINDTIREIVINEACSKTLGFKNPEEAIGKLVQFDDSDVSYCWGYGRFSSAFIEVGY